MLETPIIVVLIIAAIVAVLWFQIGAPTSRRFPPPWTVEELEACFVVIDSAEQKLAYVYFEEESGRRSAAKLLTKDEAPDCREHRETAGAIGPVTGFGFQEFLQPFEFGHQLSELVS